MPLEAGAYVRLAVPDFSVRRWRSRSKYRGNVEDQRRAALRELYSGDLEMLAPPPLQRRHDAFGALMRSVSDPKSAPCPRELAAGTARRRKTVTTPGE